MPMVILTSHRRGHPDAMKREALLTAVASASLALGLGFAGVASGQEASSQARARTVTQSLNGGPAESTLGSSPATAPLTQARPPSPAPRSASPASRDPVAELLGRIEAGSQSATAAPPAPGDDDDDDMRTAAVPAGPASALPPLPVGYYVRGDKDCNQVWPLAGDIAWLSELTFSIDFGGCDPGEIQQTSDTTWSERQTCQTELGGEGPPYIVDYEAGPDGVLLTRARLGENALGVQDSWKACSAEDVPAEARFHADDPGRAVPEVDADPDQDA